MSKCKCTQIMLDTIYTQLHLFAPQCANWHYFFFINILSMQVDLYKNTWVKLTSNTKGGTVHNFSYFIYFFVSNKLHQRFYVFHSVGKMTSKPVEINLTNGILVEALCTTCTFIYFDLTTPEHLGWGLVWDVVWSSPHLCPHHSGRHSLFPPVPGVWQTAHCETLP